MKIAVIGANGRSGKIFVELALAAGHTVTAGVHRGTLAPSPYLTVKACDATVQEDVESLIAGQDAVVSLIGHIKGSPDWVQTDAIRVVTAAMKQAGIQRIVSLTGTGVRFDGDRVIVMDRILNAAVRVLDAPRIRDGQKHVEVLKASSLEWTVMRVLKLQSDSPHTYILTAHGPTLLYVSRHDVAQAILDVLEQHSFVRQAPILSRS